MPGRREEIVSKAYEMMGDQGLESVHARTVAAALKINHATVHYYFPTRADLLKGVAEQAINRLKTDRQTFGEEAKNANDKIVADIELAEAYAAKGSRFIRVVLGLFVASLNDKALRPLCQQLWKEWQSVMDKNLGAAKISKRSPYGENALLASQLMGIAFVSQMFDGKTGAEAQVAAVSASLKG